MCERELETEQNCSILTTTLMAISVSFPYPWAAQPGAQPLWVMVFSTAPYLQLVWSSTLNRRPEGSLCWELVFSTATCLQLVWSPTHWTSCALSYIIVQRPPSSCGRHNFALIQPVHGQGYNSDIPRPDAAVIYTGAFPVLTARPGRRSIYNIFLRFLPGLLRFEVVVPLG